jgi:hemerythrin
MENQNDGAVSGHKIKNTEIIIWNDKYSTGIQAIDNQHRQLVELTNQLYLACMAGEEVLYTVFKDAMSRMVEYVRFHFTAELKLLAAINFPDYHHHKKMHDDLVRDILEAAKEFNEGKKFVPNNFVRTLKDWIFGHIAVYDKIYAAFAAEQLRTGVLTDKELKEIELSISK